MDWTYTCIITVLFMLHNSHSKPLDIVAGKSGEQQVKEALDRAEKESEQAAKEKEKHSSKEKEEPENFFSKLDKDIDNETDKSTRSSTDLKETLDKKVEELAKFHEKHKADGHQENRLKDTNSKGLIDFMKSRKNSALAELRIAESKEKENTALEEESDKKMVDMAKKLNNLVVKFQRKMGSLSGRPNRKNQLLPEKEGDGESTVKSIRGKPATHAAIDIATLRNALGLIHTKASKNPEESNAKTSYKEDTKLEDRLAMEAEEEKKFSNGDSYDDGEDESASKSSGTTAASTMSPKEQATQEMQNYNALISSESNRELSQIQEEITKATQSSMGQVSVVGQKEQVNTEAPSLPPLPGLSDSNLSELGGTGSIDATGLGANGGLGNIGGTTQYQSMQSGIVNGLEATAATGSEVSAQPTATMIEPNTLNTGQPADSSGALNQGDQAPIEIGGSQSPVEMGMIAANSNPFSNLGGGQEVTQNDQSQQSFVPMNPQGPIELGNQVGQQQPNISFKKSHISHKAKQL